MSVFLTVQSLVPSKGSFVWYIGEFEHPDMDSLFAEIKEFGVTKVRRCQIEMRHKAFYIVKKSSPSILSDSGFMTITDAHAPVFDETAGGIQVAGGGED